MKIMSEEIDRRTFLKTTAAVGAGGGRYRIDE